MDEGFLATWVAWIREQEPSAVAVLLTGSYARGQAGPHSDLDLDVLTRDQPRVPYRCVLTELLDGRLLHVSMGTHAWTNWSTERTDPADWSFGFPVREEARLLWAEEGVREQLGDPVVAHPPAPLELEDFVECLCKVKNARRAGDELALRFAAQDLARRCPGILRPLNLETRIGTPYEALQAALRLPIAPPNYREDLLVCLGLSGDASDMEEIHERATRLAGGILELLASHVALLATQMEPELHRYLQMEPELHRYLADGTLQRYLAQDDGTARSP